MNTNLLEPLEVRLNASQNQQFWPESVKIAEDPITGRRVIINYARGHRHHEAIREIQPIATRKEDCYFCTFQTTSTLFYVDDSLNIVIPQEGNSLTAANKWLEEHDKKSMKTYFGLVGELQKHNKIEGRWLTRTFYNLTPSLGVGAEAPKCFVTAIHPDYHYNNFHDLPIKVVEATFKSWQFLKEWGERYNLTVLPFINGGKRPESGQSLACFHGQTYLVKHVPSLFESLRKRREEQLKGHCPVCTDMLNPDTLRDLSIYEGTSFVVLAHPAPARNWSLLILPKSHQSDITTIDRREFALLLQYCIRGYKSLLTIEPAYNVAIRCGEAVGHLHAEIIPKTETNVPGGFEETTMETIIDVPPNLVAAELRRRIP
jgi:galactose-1-phosphate uridylyltransferase